MKTSKRGIELIKRFERFSPVSYPDGHGRSIGYGTFIDSTSEQWLHTATISEAQGEDLLKKDIGRFEHAINQEINGLNQNQFDALVSFTYNVGAAAFRASTLLRKAKVNVNDPSIHYEFLRWNKSKGQVLSGLTERRKQEAALYFQKASPKVLKRSSAFLPLLIIFIIIFILIK